MPCARPRRIGPACRRRPRSRNRDSALPPITRVTAGPPRGTRGSGAGGTMIDLLPGVALPRPAPAADAGPLDERLYDLVESRVRRLFTHNPALATMRGIHTEDHHLGD